MHTSPGKTLSAPRQDASVGFDLVAVMHDLLGIDLEWSTDGSLPKHITLVTALFTK